MKLTFSTLTIALIVTAAFASSAAAATMPFKFTKSNDTCFVDLASSGPYGRAPSDIFRPSALNKVWREDDCGAPSQVAASGGPWK